MEGRNHEDIEIKSVKVNGDEQQSPETQSPPSYVTVANGAVNDAFVPDDTTIVPSSSPPKTLGKTDVEKPPAYSSLDTETSGETKPAYTGDSQERTVSVRNGHSQQDKAVVQKTSKDDEEQYEESSDDEDEYDSKFARVVASTTKTVSGTYRKHKSAIWTCVWVLLALLYYAYFTAAMVLTFDVNDEGEMRLLIGTIVVTVFIVLQLIRKHCLKDINCPSFFQSEGPNARKVRKGIYWLLVIGTVVFIVTFVILDIALHRPENLVSALGIFVFLLLFFLFSKHPAKVKFRTVFWGLALQFYFALLILRTDPGFQAFNWLGNRVREFLAYTDAGAEFVFGKDFTRHFFAMEVLSVVIFFSSVVSVLYYLGVMQFIIRHIAKFLSFCLGTSPTESLNAAGNIFLGQTEAPLMVRPFVKDMTKSELHAIATGGFATVAGSTMAAYILMGVPANHLLSASVMSAPAALAMSKLFYPETKKSKATANAVYSMPKGQESNVLEAASNGASVAIRLVANIAVNLIAFLSILKFLDQTLIWAGHRVKMYQPELTFRFVCSYLFWPIAWLLGTPTSDVRKIAGMIGTKTFLNEFVAYDELGKFIQNTDKYNAYVGNVTGTFNGTTTLGDDIILNYTGDVLTGGILTDKAIAIATYALCGFSNIGSIGIMLGALGGMAPTRKKDVTKVVVRAMIAGNVACFMTACIAGDTELLRLGLCIGDMVRFKDECRKARDPTEFR